MALIVPVEELPPGTVSTSHVTVVVAAPATVAVKVCDWLMVRPARLGLMLTDTGTGGATVMVIVEVAVLVVSVTDLAVTATVAGLGTVPGAV